MNKTLDAEKKFYKFWQEWRDKLNSKHLFNLIAETVSPVSLWQWIEAYKEQAVKEAVEIEREKQLKELTDGEIEDLIGQCEEILEYRSQNTMRDGERFER